MALRVMALGIERMHRRRLLFAAKVTSSSLRHGSFRRCQLATARRAGVTLRLRFRGPATRIDNL